MRPGASNHPTGETLEEPTPMSLASVQTPAANNRIDLGHESTRRAGRFPARVLTDLVHEALDGGLSRVGVEGTPVHAPADPARRQAKTPAAALDLETQDLKAPREVDHPRFPRIHHFAQSRQNLNRRAQPRFGLRPLRHVTSPQLPSSRVFPACPCPGRREGGATCTSRTSAPRQPRSCAC